MKYRALIALTLVASLTLTGCSNNSDSDNTSPVSSTNTDKDQTTKQDGDQPVKEGRNLTMGTVSRDDGDDGTVADFMVANPRVTTDKNDGKKILILEAKATCVKGPCTLGSPVFRSVTESGELDTAAPSIRIDGNKTFPLLQEDVQDGEFLSGDIEYPYNEDDPIVKIRTKRISWDVSTPKEVQSDF